jgi:hypothetical protein
MPPRAKPEWTAWCTADPLTVSGTTVDVRLPDGRRHRVTIDELPDSYRLTARIASRATLSRLDAPELSIWLRNRALQLIGFHLDRSGRLLGSATVPRAALTPDEFLTYLHHLARECDRLEALITGADTE